MLLKNIVLKFIPAIFLVVMGCSSGGSSSGSDERTPTKIVAFGDSIGDPNFGPVTPWPTRVQSATGVEVRNYSRQSQTTSYFVGLAESILDAEQPSHLLILLGTNDARQNMVDAAGQNLQYITDVARLRGIKVIVATVPPNYRRTHDSFRSAQISELVRNLNGATWVEVRGAFGDDRSLIPDGIHPGDAGQQIIANLMVGAL